MDYRLDYHDFKGAFLAFGVPMMPHWHEQFMEEHGITPRVIVFDPKEPQISIRLAKIAGVDALSVFVFHIQMVGELMKEEGITENIKFIEVTGEICSTALYRYMKQTFPNAVILQSYGASEVEDVHMGMPCKPMDGTEPLAVYHPKETHYLEIIDSHGTSLEPRVGVEGELLVTAYPGEPSAFPLIRFRIGDMIRVVEDRCPHGSWSFTVLGRAELDFVKVTGGVLRVDEIIRVLQLFPEKVTDVFEFHYIIKETDKGPLLSPILKIEMVGNPNLKELARDIEEHLRINPELTYAQGVNDGRFLPLTCEPLELTDGVHKHRWIVRH
jgi:phenylacetate-coenzyme A ligase PaaK-like adenylate-forming protein